MKLKKDHIIADLHIHSKYSRACSKEMGIDNLSKWAKIKGLNLLGTGDFTHPEWIKELKSKLSEDETGILKTINGFNFVLQTEISLMYSQNGKGVRIHLIILSPDFKTVDKITEYFLKHGRIDYDGRPIFKIPAHQVVKELKEVNQRIEFIPAHIWTPHFSLFGEYNKFNAVEDAFKEQTKHIHALETGISSDPQMNRRVEGLDKYNMVSFSDNHSYWPWRLGREATIFNIKELTYDNLFKAINTGEGLVGTIEAVPNYGKYHHDGHRNCGVVLSPKESLAKNRICPVCRKKLTIGVATRIEELADRDEEYKKKDDKPYMTLMPLSEIIAKYMDRGINTKGVWEIYDKLIYNFDNEFNILLNVKKEELLEVIDEKLTGYLLKNRKGQIEVHPGFDGEYGVIVFEEKDKKKIPKPKKKHAQKGLEEF